jgi:ribulose kinase
VILTTFYSVKKILVKKFRLSSEMKHPKTTPCRRKVESSWALTGVWVSRFDWCWVLSSVCSDGSACALVEAGLVQSQSQLR